MKRLVQHLVAVVDDRRGLDLDSSEDNMVNIIWYWRSLMLFVLRVVVGPRTWGALVIQQSLHFVNAEFLHFSNNRARSSKTISDFFFLDEAHQSDHDNKKAVATALCLLINALSTIHMPYLHSLNYMSVDLSAIDGLFIDLWHFDCWLLLRRGSSYRAEEAYWVQYSYTTATGSFHRIIKQKALLLVSLDRIAEALPRIVEWLVEMQDFVRPT